MTVPVVNGYITAVSLKATLDLSDETYADDDIATAINAASRAIDKKCARRFWLDGDAMQVRLYTPENPQMLVIDDVVSITSVAIDRSGNGTFGEAWTRGTEYVAQPSNAAADTRPYEWLRVRRYVRQWFPCDLEDSVKVTGKFGWPAVPDEVVQATTILAGKLLRRSREAPYGIVTFGMEQNAIAIARTDPDVTNLISDLSKRRPFV